VVVEGVLVNHNFGGLRTNRRKWRELGPLTHGGVAEEEVAPGLLELEQQHAVARGKQEEGLHGVADEAPSGRLVGVGGDREQVQRELILVVPWPAVYAPRRELICVEDNVGRLEARVLGAKAGVGGDAAPRRADGAGAEDGFGRQAEEDVGYGVAGKVTDGRRFHSRLCLFSQLVDPGSDPCSALETSYGKCLPFTHLPYSSPSFLLGKYLSL